MGQVRRWVDISRWQVERVNPIDLVAVRDAGYTIANVALTGGRGYVSGPWTKSYLDAAAALGMGRSVYHWLDGRTPGRQQALQQLDRMTALFGKLTGFAHCVDVEETGEHGIAPPTWQHILDYVGTVQHHLDRPVVIYSGDWWWKPRGDRPGAGLTPYLMGMPTVGALSAYPGDDSIHWKAGYGGWSEYAIMQWGVAPLPGTGKCSLSVIRDPQVWAAITGGSMAWINIPASTSLRAEFDKVAPNRDTSSDGTIGDGEHATGVSDHNPDETGNTGAAGDADSINEVHARDVDSSGPWPAGWSMERFVQLILARCRSGAEKRLRYIIFNRRIWSASNDWRQADYNGVNAHTQHAHFSFRYGSGAAPSNPEQVIAPWGIVAAVQAAQKPPVEETVSAADVITALKSADGQAALRAALFGTDAGREVFRDALLKTNVRDVVLPDEPALPLGSAMHTIFARTDSATNKQLPPLRTDVTALGVAVAEARTAILAAVEAAEGGQVVITPEVLATGIEMALRKMFGDETL